MLKEIYNNLLVAKTVKRPFPLFFIIVFLTTIIFILNTATLLNAITPPTKEQIEQYRLDGTLQSRIEKAKALGNYRVSPNLVARFKHKMQTRWLEQQGYSPSQIQQMFAPPPAWQGMPTTGSVNVLAILIEFSDYQHDLGNTQEIIDAKLFGAGDPNTSLADYPYESLQNYYLRSSYDQLFIDGNVLDWYNTGLPRSNVVETRAGREALIKEVLDFYNQQGHDFTVYDNDNDGVIDYFMVFWTGPTTGWGSFWWGYQTNFFDSSYNVDGKTLGDYSWQRENVPFSPRTAIHETGHALGLPDYYDYDDSVGPDGGVGGLDMMHYNWGDHNCFSKFLLDWIDPYYLTTSDATTISPSGSTPDAIMTWTESGLAPPFEEFFMIQNRWRTGNDFSAGYPADGLLIWHVDASLNAGGTNFLYNNSYTDHKLIRLMEADGLEEIETGNGSADAGDYYIDGDTFMPNTTPNSQFYNGTSSGFSVINIETLEAGPDIYVEFYKDPNPCTVDNQDILDLVIWYYQSILDRDPEPGGAEGWTADIERILALGIDVREGFIALGKLFFYSGEYLSKGTTDTEYITDLYETFLGRTPSSGEVAIWEAELAGGLQRNLLLNYFTFAEEFRAYMEGGFGSCLTRPEYGLVNDLYRGFLSRLPENEGFNAWLALMQEAQCTGEQAVRDLTNEIGLLFIQSAEYEARNPELNNPDFSSEFVTNLYDAVLRRGAELAGYLAWKGQYDSDTLAKEQILQFFVDSAEFQGRVQEVIEAGCSLP